MKLRFMRVCYSLVGVAIMATVSSPVRAQAIPQQTAGPDTSLRPLYNELNAKSRYAEYTVSPDGHWLVWEGVGADGRAALWLVDLQRSSVMTRQIDLGTEADTAVLEEGKSEVAHRVHYLDFPYTQFHWSPDGRYLAFARVIRQSTLMAGLNAKYVLVVWDRRTNHVMHLTDQAVMPILSTQGGIAWSSPSELLYMTAPASETGGRDSVRHLSPMPSGNAVSARSPAPSFTVRDNPSYAGYDTTLKIDARYNVYRDLHLMNVGTGEQTVVARCACRFFSLAPNGKLLALVEYIGSRAWSGDLGSFWSVAVMPVPPVGMPTPRVRWDTMPRRTLDDRGNPIPLRVPEFLSVGGDIVWSPDSHSLAYVGTGLTYRVGNGFRRDVYVVRAEGTTPPVNLTGHLSFVHAQQDIGNVSDYRRQGVMARIAWGCHGACIRAVSNNALLVLYPSDTDAKRIVLPKGRFVEAPIDDQLVLTFDPATYNEGIAMVEDRGTTSGSDGSGRLVWEGAVEFAIDGWQRSGSVLVFGAESRTNPQALWKLRLTEPSPTPVRITGVNRSISTPGHVSVVQWRTLNGRRASGVLITPDSVQKRQWPTIVTGYPGAERPTINRVGYNLLNNEQNVTALLARGYAVFLMGIPVTYTNFPRDQADDIVAAVEPGIDALIATGQVDSTRLGLYGHSDGGYMVNVLVTRTHRFKAAVSGAGVSDLASMCLSWRDICANGQLSSGTELLTPVAQYIHDSPIFRADSVTTPLLLFHAKDDGQVPVQQSEEFFNILSWKGKRVRFVRFSSGGHLQQFFTEAGWPEFIGWWDTYLSAPTHPTPSQH
jgi:dipeptidyl aminopeptidase/acylaminoacyl peptidase